MTTTVKKKFHLCGYDGCTNPVTNWYQLLTRVIVRCDDHGESCIQSIIFDSGKAYHGSTLDDDKAKGQRFKPLENNSIFGKVN
jgi:hypothetical protein